MQLTQPKKPERSKGARIKKKFEGELNKKVIISTSDAANGVRSLCGGWNFEEYHVAERLAVVPDKTFMRSRWI